MMITGRQIRAARALLDMSQDELSKQTGLTPQGIRKIEDGTSQPREGTLSDITRVFDEHGVEFTDNSGVRLKPQGVEVLVGQEGLHQFFTNVYNHCRDYGGTIVQIGVDESQFVQISGNEFSEKYKQKMTALVNQRKDIKVLAIICEGDTNLEYSEYNQYRWISKDLFSPVPFYIYGENLAIINFQTVPAPTIIVHKFPAIAQAYRKQFDAFWSLARDPQLNNQSSLEKKFKGN